MKESNDNKIEFDRCPCTKTNGLFLPVRQLTVILSLNIAVILGAFLVGYFFSKKEQVDQLDQQLHHDLFADRIATSLYTLPTITNQNNDLVEEKKELPEESAVINQEHKKSEHYYAELIGFSRKESGNRFIDRLKKKGIDVVLAPVSSKTSKGKEIFWFQARTTFFQDKEALQKVVDRIVKEEKISGARILTGMK